jgi:hypothetical protein
LKARVAGRIRRLVGRLVGPQSTAPDIHASPFERFAPAGHFYSPIPSVADIERLARQSDSDSPILGVDLNEADQLALLERLAGFYPSIPFADQETPGLRYRFDNVSYSYADGVFLFTMLRLFRPRRLIEVGSGFTSALILDTNERFLDGQLDCRFIEPFPDLVESLLTPVDRQRHKIIPTRVQDVPVEDFRWLERGDVLFIDSTHVAKLNSDVNFLFCEVLPRLAPGTLIHIHDVFPPFEYPVDWFRQGRAWNEAYLLRAFLQFNSVFKIRLFGSLMIQRHRDWFASHMPLCLKNPGGAFWMEKVG